MVFQTNASGTFQKGPWLISHIYITTAFGCHFPSTWKEAEVITLLKPGKDPKFPQNLRPVSILSTMDKLFVKAIQKIVQRHLEISNLLNPNQFGFCACHSMTLQCMRLTDQVTLNFNNSMPMAAVFFDIEKAFYTTWHPGLLYNLSKLQFSAN
jgi:hypothetical protein